MRAGDPAYSRRAVSITFGSATVSCVILGPARAILGRRAPGAGLAGAYLLAVVADFWYMYPLFAAKIIPYTSWLARMWYHRWI